MTVPLALSQNVVNLMYVVAAIGFIVGIKRLSSPTTARSGNLIAAAGMLVAVAFTFASPAIDSYGLILGGIAVGTVIGVVSARQVKMTAMPQMVALFNGVGGGAAALISAAEFHRLAPDSGAIAGDTLGALLFSALIGSISFSGSIVAFAKLQELLPGRPLTFPAQQAVNAALFAAAIRLRRPRGRDRERDLDGASCSWPRSSSASLLVLPIGGADMPVVISFLNAFTGLAAAATGFSLQNNALIIGGTLVGASGTLLTIMMGRAMNRSLANVLFSAFGAAPSGRRGRGRGHGRADRSRDDTRRPRRHADLRAAGDDRSRLRARGRPGTACRARARGRPRGQGRRREVRDSPGRRPHAGAHERPARRGRRPVPPAPRHGRGQPRVPAHRRRARHRRERRHEPGRANRHDEPALRHADPRRRSRRPTSSSSSAAWRPASPGSTTSSTSIRETAMLFGDAKASLEQLVASAKQVA